MSQTLKYKNGDLFINRRNGRGELISDLDKCSQDILEILLTSYDSERNYGSELATINVPMTFGTTMMAKGIIGKKISECITRLKTLQANDYYSTADERIDSIVSLDVRSLRSNSFIFILQVLTESGKVSSKEFITITL